MYESGFFSALLSARRNLDSKETSGLSYNFLPSSREAFRPNLAPGDSNLPGTVNCIVKSADLTFCIVLARYRSRAS